MIMVIGAEKKKGTRKYEYIYESQINSRKGGRLGQPVQ
jgi:hypothetical protein